MKDSDILELNCGESGTLLYFGIAAAVAAKTGLVRIVGEGTLLKRGINSSFLDALKQQGVCFATNNKKLPITLLCGCYDVRPAKYRKIIKEELARINRSYLEKIANYTTH